MLHYSLRIQTASLAQNQWLFAQLALEPHYIDSMG